jgi:hypothetical protein
LGTIRLSAAWRKTLVRASKRRGPYENRLRAICLRVAHLPEEFVSRLSRAAEQNGARRGI